MLTLEFTFDIQPDEHGVFDGRVLAEHLIMHAYCQLPQYTNGCLGCADDLFAIIANNALHRVHELPEVQSSLHGVDDHAERRQAHLQAAMAGTEAALSLARHMRDEDADTHLH